MISLSAEQVEELFDAFEKSGGGPVDNEAYQLAVNWEEKICCSSYDVAITLCKRTKQIDQRQRDFERFVEFVANSFVEVCDLGSEFTSFMMCHIRDEELDLPEQIRQLHNWVIDYDYSNTFRH